MRANLAVWLAIGLASPLVGAAGCGEVGPRGGAIEVSTIDFGFDPRRLKVKIGDTVSWTNAGKTAHNVIGHGFRTTAVLDPGESYSHRFTRAGRFGYICTLHPAEMKGTIVVGR